MLFTRLSSSAQCCFLIYFAMDFFQCFANFLFTVEKVVSVEDFFSYFFECFFRVLRHFSVWVPLMEDVFCFVTKWEIYEVFLFLCPFRRTVCYLCRDYCLLLFGTDFVSQLTFYFSLLPLYRPMLVAHR